MFKYAFVVYQAGIANVFRVDALNLSPTGRNAKRLKQGSFLACENFAQGLGEAGICVRSAYCNQAGDIADAKWKELDDDVPFLDKMHPISNNSDYENDALKYFLMVMDGCKGWHEIQESTGLQKPDCEAIYDFYAKHII